LAIDKHIGSANLMLNNTNFTHKTLVKLMKEQSSREKWRSPSQSTGAGGDRRRYVDEKRGGEDERHQTHRHHKQHQQSSSTTTSTREIAQRERKRDEVFIYIQIL
jgi:hypothetical protein